MSNKARDWARSVETSTWSEAIVLRELAEYYNDEKASAWPSIETLHGGCNGISQRTIRRSLTALVSQGLITRIQRGTKNQTSVYTFNLNWPTSGRLTSISTGQNEHLNWPNQVSQLAKPGKSTGQILHVIEEEPLRTFNEPLEPVPVEVQPATQGKSSEDDFFTRTVKAYEDNIGMIPRLVVEDIQAIAEGDNPPADWGEKAIKVAVFKDARNWGFIKAVINRYIAQGNTDDRPEDRRKGRTNHGRPGVSENGSGSALDRIAKAQGNFP